MKAYVITTGIVFALIVLAHGARVVAEGAQLVRESDFLASSGAFSCDICIPVVPL